MASKIKNEKTGKVELVSEKDYISSASKSGDVLLTANKEKRLYENARDNGTTRVILAALGASGSKKRVISGEEYIRGVEKLLRDNFENPEWKRLEKVYRSGANRSSSPAKKIGPVLRALKTKVNRGYISGFNVPGIGTDESRRAFGFTFAGEPARILTRKKPGLENARNS